MNLQILKKNPRIEDNDHRRIDISTREVDRLEGIFKELLNALEASPKGATIDITSSFEPSARDEATIIIADQGPGVSREHLPDIFKPFFTTKSRARDWG